MNFSLSGHNKPALNCSRQRSFDIGPAYPNLDLHDMFFVHGTGCKADISYLHPPCWKLYENDPYYFNDDYSDFVEEELYDIDWLITLERLTCEYRE